MKIQGRAYIAVDRVDWDFVLQSAHREQYTSAALTNYSFFPGDVHSIPRVPRLLLPVQEPARLPRPHRDGAAQESGARRADEHRVHGLGPEHRPRQGEAAGTDTLRAHHGLRDIRIIGDTLYLGL